MEETFEMAKAATIKKHEEILTKLEEVDEESSQECGFCALYDDDCFSKCPARYLCIGPLRSDARRSLRGVIQGVRQGIARLEEVEPK